MPAPLVVIAAISAAASVGGTVAGVSGDAKKRMYEKNYATLNADEKKELEKKLIGAKSEEARQVILANTLGNISAARVQGLAEVQKEREKTKKYLIITGGIIVGAILIVLIIKRK